MVCAIQITVILCVLSILFYFTTFYQSKEPAYIVRNNLVFNSGGQANTQIGHGLKIWLPETRIIQLIDGQSSDEGDTIILKDEYLQQVAQINIRQMEHTLPYGSIVMANGEKLSRQEMDELLRKFIALQMQTDWPGQSMEWRHFGHNHIRSQPVLYGLGILHSAGNYSSAYKCVLILGSQADLLFTIIFPTRFRMEVEPELNKIVGSVMLPGALE